MISSAAEGPSCRDEGDRRKQKKKKHKKRRRDEEEDTDTLARSGMVLKAEVVKEEAKVKVSKSDFFARLLAAEAAKPRIGTVHATGKKEESSDEKEVSKDWECHKCFYKNCKECITCSKCRALRRFEGRNQAYSYCQ